MSANPAAPPDPKCLYADRYERHHAVEAKYGYTYAEDDRIATLVGWVGQGHRVLDVGCRDGTMTARFLAGNEVVGVDVDRTALRLAAEHLGIETHWADLNQRLPFGDASFDLVFCGEVLEHLVFPDDALLEFARVLPAGGRLIGSVPNAFRLRNRLRFLLGREFDRSPVHLHHFSPSLLRRLLSAQFESVELAFRSSRLLALSPRLMGSTMCFCAVRRAGDVS